MSATTPRLVPLRPEQLDPAQRRLYDAVLASPRGQGRARRLILREDGTLTGPFDAWLRTPELGAHLERVGMALRTETALPAAARETAVLVVARAWSADFECRAEGLGCVLTTLLCRREKEVRELLAIPEPWATAALVPIGWPASGGHGPLARRPVEQVAFADRFGEALFASAQEDSG